LYPLFAERYLSFTPDAPLKDTVAECARL
jgi:hypothetical protein